MEFSQQPGKINALVKSSIAEETTSPALPSPLRALHACLAPSPSSPLQAVGQRKQASFRVSLDGALGL